MKTTAKNLIDYFGLKLINKESADLSREIKSSNINRAGLQLGGLKVSDYYKTTLIAWGTKEFMFFESISKTKRIERINKALSRKTPILVLSKKYKGEIKNEIVEEASKKGIPVVKVSVRVGDIAAPFASWIAEKNDIPQSIHASLVIINGVGVMITGPSGIGKSEAVLELIHNEHTFVSDDTVEMFKVNQALYGRSPKITKDLLEARGIGLLSIPMIYGQRSTTERAKIELEVQLVPEEKMNTVDRLGTKELKKKHMGTEVPLIQIPTGTGRSVAILIEAATNVFLARRNGVNPIELIHERTKEADQDA